MGVTDPRSGVALGLSGQVLRLPQAAEGTGPLLSIPSLPPCQTLGSEPQVHGGSREGRGGEGLEVEGSKKLPLY